MKAIFKHELRGYLHSLTAYIFCAFMLAFVGIGAMLYNIQQAVANFEYVLYFVCIGLAIIIPVLTMRTIAEEKKQKTDRLLYSLPIKTEGIILGKYLALLVIFAVPVAVIAFYPLVFSRFGEVYLPTSYGTLLAFFLMGAAMISVGMFISSLTENQGIAAVIGIALFVLNYFSVTLADYISSTATGSVIALVVLCIAVGFIIKLLTRNGDLAYWVGIVLTAAVLAVRIIDGTLLEGLLPKIMSALSLFEPFYNFVDGVFDLTSIVFYLSVAALFLFLSVQSMEKRRYN